MRHGRTSWNGERRFQGQTDVPLDEGGRTQAAALARSLMSVRFERCISSDLSRAAETARAICRATRTELKLELDPRWREFDFGDWEGLTWEQILTTAPELSGQPGIAVDRYAPPRGETYGRVRERVASALGTLEERDGHLLIVTHAGPLHAALDVLVGDGAMDTRLAPAGITRLRRAAGGWRLLALGQ